MTDVFICYSRCDLDFVRHLAEALRERATDIFGSEIDLQQKRHTDLVPWSELGESRRELDHEAQRELPALLANTGWLSSASVILSPNESQEVKGV